jgi:hypothetical protein
MQEHLDRFLEGLKEHLGGNLVSVVLYGSAAEDGHDPKKSDVNVMVVLHEASLDPLSSAEKILLQGQRKANIRPVFWTKAELKGLADTFPVEFTGILKSHKIIYGADPLKGVRISPKNLRHQLEFELASKLLRLRSAWSELRGDSYGLEVFLVQFGTSFGHLFQHAAKLLGKKLKPELSTPFEKCRQLKRKEIKLKRDGLEKLYHEVHDAASAIVKLL